MSIKWSIFIPIVIGILTVATLISLKHKIHPDKTSYSISIDSKETTEIGWVKAFEYLKHKHDFWILSIGVSLGCLTALFIIAKIYNKTGAWSPFIIFLFVGLLIGITWAQIANTSYTTVAAAERGNYLR